MAELNGKITSEGCPEDLAPKAIATLEDSLQFLPAQSLPRPFSNLFVNPNAISYSPSATTPCIPASVNTLTGLLTWLEQNIIAPYCDLATGASCRMHVSRDDGTGTIRVYAEDIKQALIRCMGLTDLKPHIVYDNATGSLIAGKIDGSKPDCTAFVNLFKACPQPAPVNQKPDYVIGYFQDTSTTPNTLIPQTYKAYFTKPTKLFAQIPFGDVANNYATVSSNQRLIVKNMVVNRHENADDAGTFEPAVNKYKIGKEGWYRVAASVMINTKYQALSGWIVALMMGIRHDKYSVNLTTPPVSEYRLDERILYLDGTASDGQDITLTGSIEIYCGYADELQLRAWFSNTYVPGGSARTIAMHINRNADTVYSISRIPEYDTRIIGN